MPALKLVTSHGIPVDYLLNTASDSSKQEYFCMRMEEDKPVETHGPFPSSNAAEDAVKNWYVDGEWYICTKIKVINKTEHRSFQ